MSGILSPAVGVMNRLSVQGKMALLGVIAMVPVIVLAYMLNGRIEAEINFTRKETQTVPMVMPARQLMQAVQAHRGVSQTVIGGNTALAGRLSELQAKVAAALKDGNAVDARYGAALGTAEVWRALRQDWDEVQAKAVSLGAEESFRLHTAYIERVRDFITSIADRTNATLDPELETFYLMDVFAVRLPTLAEDAGRARALGASQAMRQKQTEAERVEMTVMLRRMQDGRAAIDAALSKAGSQDVALRANLSGAGKALDASLKDYLELVQTGLLSASEITLAPTQYFDVATKAVDSAYGLFDLAAREFDQRLAERLASLERARALVFGVIAVSLLVVGYLFIGLRRAMLQAIGQIEAGVGRMSQGKLDEKVVVTSRDAFGDIAGALNNMQSNLLAKISADKVVAESNLRVRNALDKANTNIMLADTDGHIVYCNEAVLNMLRNAERDIRKDLPTFQVEGLVGRNFDVFHKNPAHQRNILGHLSGEHRATVKVGGRTFGLVANPVINAEGVRLGSVVEWVDRTDEVHAEEELATLMRAALAGDFSQRLSLEGKKGFFITLSEGMNQLTGIISTTLNDLARVLNAIARGDLTEKITADYGGTFGQLKDDTNTTVERLREVVGQIKEASE
ncbi:MAG: HAMP domain-containing protein, partial [Zoogloea sp.]|nr:HAMP domain-containing protein [Zoogloea sp.]